MKKTILHKADSRGFGDHGWLQSKHSFSFAGYHDPARIHFGALRVLNDDIVAGGKGFGLHPHDNMEIISIPLAGALRHKDTTGREAVIHTGDVQIMSAGSGIAHSEMNASATEAVNFLQIWVFPKKRNIEPRYQQKSFSTAGGLNTWQVVVSPVDAGASLWINQDAWLSLGEWSQGTAAVYEVHRKGNGVYAFVIDGDVTLAGQALHARDGFGISDTESISLLADRDARVLMIEVPMQF